MQHHWTKLPPLLVVSAIAGVIIGKFAPLFTELIVCEFSLLFFDFKECGQGAKVTALHTGTFFSTVFIILSLTLVARQGIITYKHMALSTLVAMASAFGALIKAAKTDSTISNSDLIVVPLILFIASSVAILYPIFVAPAKNARCSAEDMISRILLAAIIGYFVGLAIQGLGELMWSGTEYKASVRKFIVAPSAVVPAVSAFAMLFTLNQQRHRHANVRLLLMAVLLVLGFVCFQYWPTHSTDGEWLQLAGMGLLPTIFLIAGLILPFLLVQSVMGGLAVSTTGNHLLVCAIAAGLVAAASAYYGAQTRIDAGKMLITDIPVLVTVHFLSAASIVVVIDLAQSALKTLARLTAQAHAD